MKNTHKLILYQTENMLYNSALLYKAKVTHLVMWRKKTCSTSHAANNTVSLTETQKDVCKNFGLAKTSFTVLFKCKLSYCLLWEKNLLLLFRSPIILNKYQILQYVILKDL